MSRTYQYLIPDECWINDFSSNIQGTFTYSGPDELIATVVRACGSAYTQKLDGPVYDTETTITINVVDNPELLVYADLLWGRPDDYEIESEERTDNSGATYIEVTNRPIHDYYWPPVYDFDNEEWRPLQLFEKDTLTPKMRTFLSKADMFIEILDNFELDETDTATLTTFKAAVEDYRNLTALPWKYPGVNPFEKQAPKIPMTLITRLNEIKESNLDTLYEN